MKTLLNRWEDSFQDKISSIEIIGNDFSNLQKFKNNLGFSFSGIDYLQTQFNFQSITGNQSFGDIWFNANAIQSGVLVEKSGSFNFYLNNSGNLTLSINDSFYLTGSTTIQTGLFYQSFWTFDPSNNLSIYLNGVKEAEKTVNVPSSVNLSNEKLIFGKNFDGLMGGFSYWSGTLSSGEIKTLYADGGGTYYDYTFDSIPSDKTINYISRVVTDGGFVLRPNQIPNGTGILAAKFNSGAFVEKTYSFTNQTLDQEFSLPAPIFWNESNDVFNFKNGYLELTAKQPVNNLTDPAIIITQDALTEQQKKDFFDSANSSDGTKARIYLKNGGRMPLDIVNWDGDKRKFCFVYKHTGVFSVSTRTVELYPPKESESSVSLSDEFGGYNAYKENYKGFYFLDNNSSVQNRASSGQNDLTVTSSPVVLESDGIYKSLEFDGIDDRAFTDSFSRFQPTFTISAYARLINVAGGQIVNAVQDSTLQPLDWAQITANPTTYSSFILTAGTNASFANTSLTLGTGYNHYALRVVNPAGGARSDNFSNGVFLGSAQGSASTSNYDTFSVAGRIIAGLPSSNSFNNCAVSLAILAGDRTNSDILNESDYCNDQSTYWSGSFIQT